MSGVAEESAEFRQPSDLATADRFRRIAGVGPVYEVLAIDGTIARVRMADTDDEFDYPTADAEMDPAA